MMAPEDLKTLMPNAARDTIEDFALAHYATVVELRTIAAEAVESGLDATPALVHYFVERGLL